MKKSTVGLVIALLVCMSTATTAQATTAARVVATIPVGSQPWGVAVSPDGSTAYVSNRASNSVSVIDLASRSATGTISGITAPLGLAFTPDGTHAYVTSTGAIARVVTSTNTLVQSTNTGLCSAPNNIIANPDGSAMYASCGVAQRGASISTSTQAVNDSLASVSQPINDVALAPDAGSLIWALTSSVWLQGPGTHLSLAGANAVTTVSGVNRAFTANPASGTVSVIDVAGTSILGTISVGGQPRDIAVTADGTTGYVTDRTGNRLVIVDLISLQVVGEVAVGTSPEQVALTPDETQLIVTNTGSDSVSIIDLSTPAHGDEVPRAPLQQFARAESDTCDTQPEDLVDFPALGHVKHANWGPSWAQWPNGGTGGFVCTRQPYYTSTEVWAVR